MKFKFELLCTGFLAAALSLKAYAADSYMISHESGIYPGTQMITIKADDTAEIYYTTDGSKPDMSCEQYRKEPIRIDENTTIKVVSYVDGKEVERDSYRIKIRTPSPYAGYTSGEYSEPVSVKLYNQDENAVIYYTTDGSEPDNNSKKYVKPIKISKDTTLKFIAYSENHAKSITITENYNFGVYPEPERQELFELVNQTREEYGLYPLKELPELSAAAQTRAVECASVFAHYRPDGRSWYTAISDLGLSGSNCAENIAYYHSTPSQALNSWMNDYLHRINILSESASYLAIGYYEYGGTRYWVQLFL